MPEIQPNRNVTVSIAPDISTLGNSTFLRAVIDDLLSNAWKFTADTPNAVVKFYGETTDAEIVSHVRDNGAGFDMAYADNAPRLIRISWPRNRTCNRQADHHAYGRKSIRSGRTKSGGNFLLLAANSAE